VPGHCPVSLIEPLACGKDLKTSIRVAALRVIAGDRSSLSPEASCSALHGEYRTSIKIMQSLVHLVHTGRTTRVLWDERSSKACRFSSMLALVAGNPPGALERLAPDHLLHTMAIWIKSKLRDALNPYKGFTKVASCQRPHTPHAVVRRVLRKLGINIYNARRRRRLTMAVAAERAFTSRATLQRLEARDPGVSIGIYAAVRQVLGLLNGLAEVADGHWMPWIRRWQPRRCPSVSRLPRVGDKGDHG
jgi:hypothetical protein